jgi:hypothetical protein
MDSANNYNLKQSVCTIAKSLRRNVRVRFVIRHLRYVMRKLHGTGSLRMHGPIDWLILHRNIAVVKIDDEPRL